MIQVRPADLLWVQCWGQKVGDWTWRKTCTNNTLHSRKISIVLLLRLVTSCYGLFWKHISCWHQDNQNWPAPWHMLTCRHDNNQPHSIHNTTSKKPQINQQSTINQSNKYQETRNSSSKNAKVFSNKPRLQETIYPPLIFQSSIWAPCFIFPPTFGTGCSGTSPSRVW